MVYIIWVCAVALLYDRVEGRLWPVGLYSGVDSVGVLLDVIRTEELAEPGRCVNVLGFRPVMPGYFVVAHTISFEEFRLLVDRAGCALFFGVGPEVVERLTGLEFRGRGSVGSDMWVPGDRGLAVVVDDGDLILVYYMRLPSV